MSANIFGKTASDYKHLRVLKDQGLLDNHLNGYKKKYGKELFSTNKTMKDSYMTDAESGLMYITNNQQQIMTEVEEVLYMNYRLPSLVPIINNVPEGADSYAYRVRDRAGKAKFIDSYGTSAASASVSQKLIATNILQGGIDAMWSLQDIRRAMFSGYPLDTDTIAAATEACTDHIETVGLLGEVGSGIESGLINNPDVPVESAATALEDSTDAADLINDYINQIIETTDGIFGKVIRTGLTIYLPYKQFNFLATKKYATDASQTIMSYLERFNAWTAISGSTLTFQSLGELKDAGASNKDRMIIAFNDQRVMEMANPIQPRLIGIYDRGRYVFAPLEYSISALNFKHPKACLYVDFAEPALFLAEESNMSQKKSKKQDNYVGI